MGTHANSVLEAQPDERTGAVNAPMITPGWVYQNRKRRHVQNPFIDRVLERLFPDQRRHTRFLAPPIVAYLGSVGSSRLFPIIDVSVGGFCLRADEFWSPGIVMPITLQRWRTIPQDDPESITLQAMLVRREADAAGFAIALASDEAVQFPHRRMQRASDLHAKMMDFLKDLPEPVVTTPGAPIHAAMSAHVVRKAERLDVLLGRTDSHELLAGAWCGDGEQKLQTG